MSILQKIAASVLIVLLLAAGYGLWATNDQVAAPVQKASATSIVAGANAMPVIDERTLLTARRLARYADTAEERAFAQSAIQTADHELDLAFAAALHHLETHPQPLSPEAASIQGRMDAAQKALAADAENLKQTIAQLAQAKDADKPSVQDRIDLAGSQVELDQDEVQEANEDLLRAGGNIHQKIQTMQQEHEAAEHADTTTAPAAPGNAFSTLKGMVGELRQWLALRKKQRWLTWARQQVAASADQLAVERQKIAAQLAASKALLPEFTAHPHASERASVPAPAHATSSPAGVKTSAAPAAPKVAAPPAAPSAQPAAAGANEAPATLLDLTRQIAAQQRRLILRDERIAARRRLADVYGQWDAVVETQAGTVLHACLAGAAIVIVALLILLFIDGWLERLLGRARIDRRQLQTLRSVVGVALQLVGVVIIVLVLVGLPGQLGTLLGILGAGLAVALKDFIVAFIGWFVLMGKNGMRLGDWVEINGVSGEVIELNMFHTVLLETGNWTDAGHPTGRRVTFTNSFAISGHYFNFSTSGQWLWDELSIVVPYERDPHAIADAIQKEVTAATAADASEAEQEWKRASRGQRDAKFTAQPGISVRPAAGGVEIAVRYVTRASERLALRGKLYQTAVQLLGTHS